VGSRHVLAAFIVLTLWIPANLRAQSADKPEDQPNQQPGFGECWRLNDGRWQKLPGDVLLDACVGELYSGGCAGPRNFYYGRWGNQTLRLTNGRVEVSSNNQDFTTLVDPWPGCHAATSTQSTSAPVSPALPPSAEPSADFQRGQQARQDFEAWFHGLNGDYLQGAAFWTGNRSRVHHAGCDGSGIPGVTPAWTAGCMAAEQRLTPSDQLRHLSPDYRLGWNSIPDDPGDYNAGIPTDAQSQSAFDNSAPQSPQPGNEVAAVPPAAPATPPIPHGAEPMGSGWALALLALLVVVFASALAWLWVIPLYNRLVVLRQNANRAFADMDVLLKQRRDLIPNIVETVKGYASHESATLEAVVSLRSVAAGSGDVNEKVTAERSLSSALGRVFALAEAYPDLKANTSFLSQQHVLSDIEFRLSNMRMSYNGVISGYNSAVLTFPAVLIAGILGFRSREFFDVGAEERSELNKSESVQRLTQSLRA
jgi:LemA protein